MANVNDNFIAGHYTATYGPGGSAPADIGTTRSGFRIRETMHAEQILTDDSGQAPVEGINMGAECMVTLDYVEYPKILPVIYTAQARGKHRAAVGKLLTGLAGPLVLTPAAGTTALSGGGTYTFPKAIIESDVETLLASNLRQGPLTFRVYPDATGNLYTVA